MYTVTGVYRSPKIKTLFHPTPEGADLYKYTDDLSDREL